MSISNEALQKVCQTAVYETGSASLPHTISTCDFFMYLSLTSSC